MAAPVPEWTFEVEPAWLDYNGHMNMGYFLVAFDLVATDRFYEWLGIGLDYVNDSGMSVFTLGAGIEYHRELFSGDAARIDTQLLDWDAKRIHYLHSMKREDGERVATNQCLAMNVDLETRRGAAFPEVVQERLSELHAVHSVLARPEIRPLRIKAND